MPQGDAFVWFTHQPASAAWLKRELAAKRPDLRFAFSRPGLTTFKVDPARADEPSASSFARAYGRSLGRATTPDEVLALAASCRPGRRAAPRVRARSGSARRRARRRRSPVRAPAALDAALRAAAPGRFADRTEAHDRRARPRRDRRARPSSPTRACSSAGIATIDTRGPFPGGVGPRRDPRRGAVARVGQDRGSDPLVGPGAGGR